MYGFGSDPVTGDYKVVVIKGYWPTDDDSDVKHPLSVLVYSLRTNLWKYCGDLAKAYDLESNKCYIFVSGCCYWLGSYENTSDIIVCFDMATDAFKEIHCLSSLLLLEMFTKFYLKFDYLLPFLFIGFLLKMFVIKG